MTARSSRGAPAAHVATALHYCTGHSVCNSVGSAGCSLHFVLQCASMRRCPRRSYQRRWAACSASSSCSWTATRSAPCPPLFCATAPHWWVDELGCGCVGWGRHESFFQHCGARLRTIFVQ